MTPTKESTKNWLKAINKNREWLATECETEKGTINNWLSPAGPFPASAILKIHELMVKFPSSISQPPHPKNALTTQNGVESLDRITIEVEGELQLKINQKALELGMTTSCWASLALEEAAEEPDIMERIERRYAKKNTPDKESAAKLTATHQHLHAVEPEQHETA